MLIWDSSLDCRCSIRIRVEFCIKSPPRKFMKNIVKIKDKDENILTVQNGVSTELSDIPINKEDVGNGKKF